MTTTHVPDLSITRLVEEELSWSPSPNPREIAGRIAERVPADHLRQLLADALIFVVRKIASRKRLRAMGSLVENGRRAADPAAVMGEIMAAGPGVWKRLGEFTGADLANQVAHRRTVSAEEEATTARLERLAEAVAAAGVERVEQLDLAARAAIFT